MARTQLSKDGFSDFGERPRSEPTRRCWTALAAAVGLGCSLHSLDYLGKEAGQATGGFGGAGGGFGGAYGASGGEEHNAGRQARSSAGASVGGNGVTAVTAAGNSGAGGAGGTRSTTKTANGATAGKTTGGSVSGSGGRSTATGGPIGTAGKGTTAAAGGSNGGTNNGGSNSGGNYSGGNNNSGDQITAGSGNSGTNLALNRPASASTAQTTNPVANGNDSSLITRWCASGPTVPQWWVVDLQQSYSIAGTQVMWEFASRTYGYYIEVSSDTQSWQEVANKRTNPSTAQIQSDVFSAQARYVRITITSVVTNPATWACFFDFQVFAKS